MHYDDVEYCIRLRQIGKNLLIPDSALIHKEEAEKNRIAKSFVGRKSLKIPYDRFWLTYYDHRNLVYLGKSYTISKINFYAEMFKNLTRLIIGILIYDDYKLNRITFTVSSYIDGLKSSFDNKKPKKLLYKNS